jgi:hypothetical protein
MRFVVLCLAALLLATWVLASNCPTNSNSQSSDVGGSVLAVKRSTPKKKRVIKVLNNVQRRARFLKGVKITVKNYKTRSAKNLSLAVSPVLHLNFRADVLTLQTSMIKISSKGLLIQPGSSQDPGNLTQQQCTAFTSGVPYTNCPAPPSIPHFGTSPPTTTSAPTSAPNHCSLDCSAIVDTNNNNAKLCTCPGAAKIVTFAPRLGSCSSSPLSQIADRMLIIQCLCAKQCSCNVPTDWSALQPANAIPVYGSQINVGSGNIGLSPSA